MKAILLDADWEPRPGYPLTETESNSRLSRMASATWRNPRFTQTTIDDPTPGPGEVVVRVGACGVCGARPRGAERHRGGQTRTE